MEIFASYRGLVGGWLGYYWDLNRCAKRGPESHFRNSKMFKRDGIQDEDFVCLKAGLICAGIPYFALKAMPVRLLAVVVGGVVVVVGGGVVVVVVVGVVVVVAAVGVVVVVAVAAAVVVVV